MRPLLLNDLKQECARIRKHAEKRENWYNPANHSHAPGDHAEYVTEQFGYKFVFSIMVHNKLPHRMLSASVPAKRKLPAIVSVCTAAHYLGFTGATVEQEAVMRPPAHWKIALVPPANNVVMVVEPFKDEDPK